MADEIHGVPIGDLPGIESVPDDSLLVVEFLGKAYRMPGAVLRQLFQDILDAMGSSVDDVTEARLTAAIETGDGEVDFVATRQNQKLYVQVTQRIVSEKTEKREYERLLEIRDNYPKYVLRTDEFAGGNYEGIITMHVADLLLSNQY